MPADPAKQLAALEKRVADLEDELAASDQAIANLSGRQSDVEDEFKALLRKLRGQIDLRND